MSNRSRKYNGQLHTDQGQRGRQLVVGLTMRDIADCFVMAVGDSVGTVNDEVYGRAQNGTWDYTDLHKIEDQNGIDLRAVQQNLTCRIEKMMGIFPNVPELVNK